MHVLFGMSHSGYLRNFEAGVGALLDRGHRVTVATDRVARESRPMIARLRERGEFSISVVPDVEGPPDTFGLRLRAALDDWHYLQPRFAMTPSLRNRARDGAPPFARRLEGAPAWIRRAAAAVLRALERRRPVPASLVAFIEGVRPDVVLLTPLIYLESTQVSWLRAARQLGVPTVFCVHSWDNLTTKGTLHDVPSLVLVWNQAQRAEAEELHGIPRSRCAVTGAPAFDHWFSTHPTRSREQFLGEVGVPADRPVLLYLCSSRFIAKGEAVWIEEWLRAIRSAPDQRLREAAVIVRPHPAMVLSTGDWRLGDDSARVFPREKENPVADDGRMRYFHSLYYADAVVGLNTTAMIEAAILDKPVLSVRVAGSAQVRETVHFGHIEHGLLTVAPDLDTHVQQLSEVLHAGTAAPRSREFVEAFVRPLGLECPAGDRMADLVEALVVSAGRHQM